VSSIAGRLQQVRQRLERAAVGAGRDPSSVLLVAVSKTFPASAVREAHAAGQRDFGENRVQEALQKISETADLPIRWHLLGHLQANKARKAGQAFSVVQSVHSVEVLTKLDAAAAEAGRTLDLLIQVDLANEATKFGATPEEALPLFQAGTSCRAAQIVGLMTLPPVPESPEDARPWFKRLREARDAWAASGVPAGMLRELSMGMSGDFEVAVEEGATIVRVGTAIFGAR
jgi:pyridoxal phosphate enzyme (YggS family)